MVKGQPAEVNYATIVWLQASHSKVATETRHALQSDSSGTPQAFTTKFISLISVDIC